MPTTIENISREIVGSYSSSLREKEKTDDVLDHINDKKQHYRQLSKGISELSSLLSKITWLDDLKKSDEVIIKGILAMGKEADVYFKKYYASERREYAEKDWFDKELKALEQSIDLHREMVLEIEHIIFDLRKNPAFKEVSGLLNEL